MLWRVLLLTALAAGCTSVSAAPRAVLPVPTTRQLQGLTKEEAAALLTKLEDAQRRLKAGEPEYFELLSGSLASYDMTSSSPRDVFLRTPFQRVWNIERVPTDNSLWQPFRLTYSPDGLGMLYWDIEVVIGVNGNIERVLMIYKPAPPH